MALAVGRRRLARAMHTTSARLDHIAPPHPVSHMRPILYADNARLPTAGKHRHPYSLSEFQKAEGAAPGDYEMQYQLLRGQLDKLHHEFWLDSNLRFNAAKESVLEALPEPATAREKEEALSTFHKQWLNLEKARTDVYTQEWRSKNWQVIKLAARVELQNIQKRISGVFGSNSNDR